MSDMPELKPLAWCDRHFYNDMGGYDLTCALTPLVMICIHDDRPWGGPYTGFRFSYERHAEQNAVRYESEDAAKRAAQADYESRAQAMFGADAPLTPAEAMARCPEVAALVRAADYARGGFSWTSRARNRLTAALAPFTERAGNG